LNFRIEQKRFGWQHLVNIAEIFSAKSDSSDQFRGNYFLDILAKQNR